MNLLAAMTISGSVLFLSYLLGKPLAGRYLSAGWQQMYLKVTMVMFLIPYQHFKYYYFKWYCTFLSINFDDNPYYQEIVTYNPYNQMLRTDSGSMHPYHRKIFIVLIILWFLIVCSLLCRQIIKYVCCHKRLLQISDGPCEETTHTADICRQMVFPGRKPSIRFCQSPHLSVPFTTGIFRPTIFLSKETPKKELRLYLIHEMYHIRSHDVLWKFLSFLVILLHWYNPLTYLLFFQYSRASEKACDERVLKHLNEEEKELYGEALIRAAQRPAADVSVLFADTFAQNNNLTKERILFMTRKSRSKKIAVLTAAAIALLGMLSVPISVLAYQPPLVTDEADIEAYSYGTDDISWSSSFTGNSDMYSEEDILDLTLDFSLSDWIFIDADGNQTPVSSPDSNTYIWCTHNFVEGTLINHVPQGSGCTLYYYSCDKCSLCGYVTNQVYTGSRTYVTCPH